MTEYAAANSIEIAYEAFGDRDDPGLLLIMGVGAQMLHWDERFCRLLAGRGFHVIRFDNRDVGLSAKIEGGPRADLEAALAGDASSASYTLADMAADAAGLLDHLEIAAAHVVGASMGGMIAQLLAINHPQRVLSLTSIMSTTGDRAVGRPRPEVLPVLTTPAPADRDGYVEYQVHAYKMIGSPAFPPDEGYLRRRAGAVYDRCYYPDGFRRQLVAILASGDRTDALAGVRVPTLVIHGEDDPLIPFSGGEATAKAVPGARLLAIPGMGHDLPIELWPTIVDAIADNAERAGYEAPAVHGED
jgi:pimeloyl-ACP methyl ester carboxylesterase